MPPELNNVGVISEAVVGAVHRRQAGDATLQEAESTRRTQAARETDRIYGGAAAKSSRTTNRNAETKDRAELHFSLSPEEKTALKRLLTERQAEEPNPLSVEDQKRAQEAAERITQGIDEVIAGNSKTRARVEKAVSEWFTVLSGGDPPAPLEFLNILRRTAIGDTDLK